MRSDEDCVQCLNISRRLSTPTLSKFRKRRWSLLALLTLLLLIFLATRYILFITLLLNREFNINNTSTTAEVTKESPLSCYSQTENDSLTPAEVLEPAENSIFFHETSCFGSLNSRQACSVEAAARAHPNRIIYVLFNSPVTHTAVSVGSLATLSRLPNVQLARVHVDTYANNTPLVDALARAQNQNTTWSVEHMSDLLRFITLYKFGGVYLDTDMLVVRGVDSLGADWVAREDDATVSVGAIAFSSKGIGRELAEIVVNDLEWNYRPMHWSHNGPGVINRGVLSICTVGMDITTTTTGDFSCQGFTVYHPSYFYPVHYNQCDLMFKSGSLQESSAAYGYHMWNKLTKERKIEAGSLYDVLAWKHCPRIRGLYGEKFGL